MGGEQGTSSQRLENGFCKKQKKQKKKPQNDPTFIMGLIIPNIYIWDHLNFIPLSPKLSTSSCSFPPGKKNLQFH